MNGGRGLQKSQQRFTRRFLAPLLGARDETGAPIGERAIVGRPVGPSALEGFSAIRPADPALDAALFNALHAHACELAPVEALPYPERGTVGLAMACHNLAAVTDPMLDRTFARRARPVVLRWVDALVDAIDPPSSRGEVLSRHAVVSRFLRLQRRDVIVTNWAYTYRYQGRPVPPRVLAWPQVRRVRTSERECNVVDLLNEIQQRDELPLRSRVHAVLSRSPATQLLRTDLAGELRFGAAMLGMLSDPPLRYGIARELVRQGLDRVAEPLGRALAALGPGDCPPAWLWPAVALAWEVHALSALETHRGRAVEPKSPSYEARLFLAVLPAVARAAPGGIGGLMALPDGDRERLHERAAALSRSVGMRANEQAWGLAKRLSRVEPAAMPEVHP